jgi:ABC-type branched-subunit amino acid transport system ATPase component
MSLLEVQDVVRRFGGVVAVGGVSLAVGAGEVVGVIGPNGAGKSTLLSLIAGRPVTSGRVYLEGRALPSGRDYRFCRAGIVRTFQIPRPFSSLSVADNIAAAARFGSAGRKPLFDDVIATCGLGAKAGWQANLLTASERRRLELGRALACAPRVLLVDEVGAGLAEEELDDLSKLIAEVSRAGVAVLVVEHVVGFVAGVASRLVVMDRGLVLAEGPCDAVLSDEAVIEAYLGTGA